MAFELLFVLMCLMMSDGDGPSGGMIIAQALSQKLDNKRENRVLLLAI